VAINRVIYIYIYIMLYRANAPLTRPLAADDVAAAAVFLLSPLARCGRPPAPLGPLPAIYLSVYLRLRLRLSVTVSFSVCVCVSVSVFVSVSVSAVSLLSRLGWRGRPLACALGRLGRFSSQWWWWSVPLVTPGGGGGGDLWL
jgi:hypothetical protein